MTYKLGSLFDGSGGFPLAGSLCGIEPVWAAEVEPYPVAVTRSRFPNMKHYGDVSKINGAEVEPVDIITFGAPCQDLSVAGKRKGLRHEDLGDEETTRSGLFWEAVRIIKEMREATNGRYPAFAVYENVPGAFSSSGGEDWRTVLQSLVQIVEPGAVVPDVPKGGWAYADWFMGDGWSLAYRILDAQYWGVPQRRRRVYLVLDLRGERAGKILFECEGLRGYFAQSGAQGETVAGDAEAGSGADDRARESGVIPNLLLDDQGGQQINVRTDDKCPTLRAEAHGNVPAVVEQYLFENHSQDTRYKGLLDVCPMLPAQLGTGGNNTPFVVEGQPVAFSFDSLASNSMKSSNPHSGCRQVEVAKTLDTTDPNPSKNQGGIAVVEQITEVKAYDIGEARLRTPSEYTECAPTLTARCGTGGNNTPAVVYCLQGSMIGRADKNGPQGDGVNEDVAFTCNTIDRHVVAFQTYQKVTGPLMANSHPGSYTGQDAFNDMLVAGEEKTIVFDKEVYQSGQNSNGGHYISEGGPAPTLRTTGHPPGVCCAGVDCRNLTENPELYPTLQAKPNGGQSLNYSGAVRVQYIDTTHADDVVRVDDVVASLQALDAKGGKLVQVNYIVRRLTPTECARLQGFPDKWGHPDHKDSLTDEEAEFWREVHLTDCAINGKKPKPKIAEKRTGWQAATCDWYNKRSVCDAGHRRRFEGGNHMDIMTYIAKGRENAIKRDDLVRILNLPDRVVRKMIQEARDRGEVILNDQSGAGYYTSDDVGELERQFRSNKNRAMSILRQQVHIRRRVEALKSRDQVTMEEVTG